MTENSTEAEIALARPDSAVHLQGPRDQKTLISQKYYELHNESYCRQNFSVVRRIICCSWEMHHSEISFELLNTVEN
jgi:hypothetical protein